MFSWIKYINGLKNERHITEKEREALENYCNSDKYEEDSNQFGENGKREAINNKARELREI